MSNTLVPMSRRKERLSIAYISAVAAKAGFDLLETRIDVDSVDGILKGAEGLRPQIDFQAKATSRDILRSDHLSYPLSKKNYDDLRAETVVPRLLVVFLMPSDDTQWLSLTEDELVLRNCAYWMSLRGRPSVDNESSVTVHLPRSQVFDESQLRVLMMRAESGPNL